MRYLRQKAAATAHITHKRLRKHQKGSCPDTPAAVTNETGITEFEERKSGSKLIYGQKRSTHWENI